MSYNGLFLLQRSCIVNLYYRGHIIERFYYRCHIIESFYYRGHIIHSFIIEVMLLTVFIRGHIIDSFYYKDHLIESFHYRGHIIVILLNRPDDWIRKKNATKRSQFLLQRSSNWKLNVPPSPKNVNDYTTEVM